jgi:hypothetical protein
MPSSSSAAAASRDLWEILRWLIAGVGGDWSVADIDATGKLYRIPAATG